MKYTVYIILLSVFIQACGDKAAKSEFPSAGVITYVIDYPAQITNSPTGNLMPDKMMLSFNEHQIHYNFKGSFNVFSLDFYSPYPEDSCATVFRFMNNKMVSKGSVNSNFFIFDEGTTPRIKFNKKERKMIAGMACKKGEVTFKNFPPIEIYYTDSINLHNPNRHTPFENVPGVMLEFSVDYNGVRFHFKADKVDYSIPKKSEFDLPQNAKNIQRSEIEDLIITLIHNFN